MSFERTTRNSISLANRLKGLRQALQFGKLYPITKAIGIKAPSLTLTLPPLPKVTCPECGGKGRK